MISFISKNKEETIHLGEMIAHHAFPGAVILLVGDLGAGKTTLTNGIAHALGIHEKIMSPTFNILKCYFHGKIPFYHIDAYRLEEGTNRDIGLEEYIEGDGICAIEWPSYIQEWIPTRYLEVKIEHVDGDTRKITITSHDQRFNALLEEVKEAFLCTESF